MDEPKRYESIKHIVSIAEFVIDALLLIYFLTSGWSLRIRNLAESVSASEWVTVMMYVLIFGAVFKIVDLPLAFYSGYVLEHRFGLSRQTFWGWMKDQFKALVVGVPLTIGGVEVIYQLLRAHPEYWWIYASLAFITFVVVMANLAPVVLLPLFFKFKPVVNQDLQNRVNRLVRKTGAASSNGRSETKPVKPTQRS